MERVGAVLVETYRLVRLSAEGGMGEVYEAQHLRVPKRFAVKFLKVSLLDKSEATSRFRREAEILASLDHPNVVSLFDYNISDDGAPYIVFEFLDGEHLGRRIARRPMTLPEMMRVVVPIGHALEAAHAREIVHRDLKPENIFLCKSEAVKVVDFGVAKLAGAEGLTAFNTTVGTVPYMSPEQIMGGAVDGRTDQFALAAIIYEMLTGQSCFAGPESLPDQAVRVIRHQPAAPPGLAPAVWSVIERALSKSSDARYPRIGDFVEALLLAVGAMSQQAVEVATDDGLAPLGPDATQLSPQPRFESTSMPTPKSQVHRAALLTADTPEGRAVALTGKVWLHSAWLRDPRVLLSAGVALGIFLVAVVWLIAR